MFQFNLIKIRFRIKNFKTNLNKKSNITACYSTCVKEQHNYALVYVLNKNQTCKFKIERYNNFFLFKYFICNQKER